MKDTDNIAYRVESARLLLRCWNPDDAPLMRAALDESDQHLRPWIPFMANEPRTLDETLGWLRELRATFDRSEHFRFAVLDRENGALVGENMLLRRVGPEALELGYLTHINHLGQGYASEATAVLTRLAFELYKVRRVEIHHAAANAASGKIPQNLGFTLDATRKDLIVDTAGERHDCLIWCLGQEAYQASPVSDYGFRAFDAAGRLQMDLP